MSERRFVARILVLTEDHYLNASHYRDLATREYPGRAVYAVGKSFAETVDGLSTCEPLRVALEAAVYDPR